MNMLTTRRGALACLFATATLTTCDTAAQQYNATPAIDNPHNTSIDKTATSPGFRCGATVATVWATAAGDLYTAFSDDRIWYRVEKLSMHPLLYTAYSLGRKVCYQTKGYATQDIAVNVVFFDPLH